MPSRRRLVEFLVTGGATLVLLPLSWLLRRVFALDDAELAAGMLTFYAAYVVNDPHFTVTYLLFYEDARRRAFGDAFTRPLRIRWWLAGVLAPIALVGWATLALSRRSADGIGWMVQLMYVLVGWHYVKQGFGVLSVLSARRGVVLDRRERITILFHCYAAWAFAWANPSLPAGAFEEKGLVYNAVAKPRWLELGAGAVLAASTVALLFVLVERRRRTGHFLPFAPLGGLVITIWAWTIFSSADPLLVYFIPALHSIQYFYFVWLMKRNEARAHEGPPHFGRPVAVRLALVALGALGLGFVLFRFLPTFFDDAFVPRWKREPTAEALGPTPFFAAFFVAVNLHHYVMDAVLWRKENPATRWLRDDVERAREAPSSAEASPTEPAPGAAAEALRPGIAEEA